MMALGLPELAIIAVVAGIIFFGKGTVVEWVKTIAQAKKIYKKEMGVKE